MQDLPPLNPDGHTSVGQLSPRQGLRRVDTGAPLPGQGSNTGTAPSQSSPSNQSSGSDIPGVPGIVGGAISMGLGLSPLGHVPGVTAGVNATLQGSSLDAIQDAVLGDLLGWGGASLASNLGLGYGIPGIVGAVTSEAVKDNPNYGATALGSTAQVGSAMLGGAVAGPLGAILGGTIGGSLANSSLKEGYLGDLTDSRSREKDRDAVESAFGVSVGDTESMARVDSLEGFLDGLEAMAGAAAGNTGRSGRSSAMDANLGFGFGLDQFSGSTLTGKLGGLASVEKDLFGWGELEGFLMDELDSVSSPSSIDARTDYGRDLNNSGLLGDRDLSPAQNMDRQPDETPGGLFGGGDTSSGPSSGGIGGVSGADMGKGGESW